MIHAAPDAALVPPDASCSGEAAALSLTLLPLPLPKAGLWRLLFRDGGWRQRVLVLMRTLLVGLWSSAVDLLVLTLCVRWFHVEATLSRLIALVVSGILLFFGCRAFAFRARAGSVSRQARLFVLGELLGFPLNLLVFHLLAVSMPSLAPELASQAANFIVFIGFAYPVRRRLVFRVPPDRLAACAVVIPSLRPPAHAERVVAPLDSPPLH